MARKVLGNDPFGGAPAAPRVAKKSAAPPPAKKSAKAGAKPSVRPPPKPARKSEAPPPAVQPEAAAPLEDSVVVAVTEVLAEAVAPVENAVVTAAAEAVTEAAAETGTRPVVEAPTPSLEVTVAQLDALLDQAGAEAASEPVLSRLAARLRALTLRPSAPPATNLPARTDEPFDAARELLASDFYLRRWGQTAIRDRSEEIDEFGLDPDYARRWQPVWDFLYERWWRVEVEGVENVPATGRVALVANHSGAIPFDGIMLATALRKEHSASRTLRWLAEDFIFHFPFAGAYVNRLGAVRACQENAERLLRRDACVALFPEGVKGIAKPFRERYQLQRFGRGGHIKLAIRTGTPIVPVTVVGAEETHPMLFPSGRIAKLLGVPFVPLTPTFPLFGPLGLAGLPARWKIVFGEPIAMDGYRPEQAEDLVLVNRLNEKLRETIQASLDGLLRARQSVFKG